MSELSERVVLSRTRVSRIVAELVTGWAGGREGNPDDGRSAFAVMTPTGWPGTEPPRPLPRQHREEFAGSLTDAELGSIANALRKVLQQPMTLGPHGPRD